MAKKEQKKKNYMYAGKDEGISFKELVESRRQEVETTILPGYYTIVRDPKGKAKDVKVYSVPYMKRSTFSVDGIE